MNRAVPFHRHKLYAIHRPLTALWRAGEPPQSSAQHDLMGTRSLTSCPSRRWAGLALLNPSAVRLRYRLGGAICCRFSVVFRQFRGTVLAESLTTFGFYLICFAQGIIGAWFFDALLLSFAGIVVEHYKVWILYLKLMNVALTMMNSVIKMSDFARNSGMWKTWLRGSC